MRARWWLVIFAVLAASERADGQIDVIGPSFAALSVPDLPASVQWYRENFGLAVVFEAAAPDSSTQVRLLAGHGVRIELVWHRDAKPLSAYAGKPTPPDMAYGSAKIGFFVADLDRAIASLRAHGTTIEGAWLERPDHVAPSDSVWTRNILVRDNSGTYLQLFEARNSVAGGIH